MTDEVTVGYDGTLEVLTAPLGRKGLFAGLVSVGALLLTGCGGNEARPAQTPSEVREGGGSSPGAGSVSQGGASGGGSSQGAGGGGAGEPAPSSDVAAGVKAFDAGNYASARASFQAAAKKNPKNYEALYNLGMSCEKLGDKSAAENAYKAALAVKPDLDSAAEALSAMYIEQGRIDEALAVGRAGLRSHPGSAALHENLGVALATRGDEEAATKELEEATRTTPNDPMLQLTLAHWLNVWHVRGAAFHLDTAASLAKGNYGLIASIGHEYRMAGEFASCVKTFDGAISVKDGAEVRTERALCKLGLKDESGAMKDLNEATTVEPNYAPAHYYWAGRLATAKQFKDAAREYAKYLELEPNGSLAKAATERLHAAQEAAGGPAKKKP